MWRSVATAIENLKSRRRAVILAHNYQPAAVQEIADFVGDSLELSRRAQSSVAEVIVFCAVRFMAETAAILSPEKTVLIPRPEASCPMAQMVDVDGLREIKERHPAAVVVCYVNTTAAVKAESDVCCTSANAVQIVSQIPADREILFVPDQYLGAYIQRETSRRMILWPGYCPTHARIQLDHIRERKRTHPEAAVVVHPECRPDVAGAADEVLSTGGMCRFLRRTQAETVIVGTEIGLLHRLRRENPEKRVLPAAESAICPNMKLTTLEDVRASLERMEHRIEVPQEVRCRAWRSLARMLESSSRLAESGWHA